MEKTTRKKSDSWKNKKKRKPTKGILLHAVNTFIILAKTAFFKKLHSNHYVIDFVSLIVSVMQIMAKLFAKTYKQR